MRREERFWRWAKNRVLGCGEKIESEDGQRIGFERGAIFFFFFCILGFMYYWVLEEKKIIIFVFLFKWLSGFREKKNQNFCIFVFLNDANMENCGANRGIGFIYIYIYIYMGVPINKNKVVGRVNRHPIVTVPLWKSTPASDG